MYALYKYILTSKLRTCPSSRLITRFLGIYISAVLIFNLAIDCYDSLPVTSWYHLEY